VLSRSATLLAFRVNLWASVYVAECHANIVSILAKGDRVYDYDAHCDIADTEPKELTCGSWRVFAEEMGVRMMGESYFASDDPAAADVVFLCRSSPWTPKFYDPSFAALAGAMAKKAETPIVFVGKNADMIKHGNPKEISCRSWWSKW
jgi:hypothetical protein